MKPKIWIDALAGPALRWRFLRALPALAAAGLLLLSVPATAFTGAAGPGTRLAPAGEAVTLEAVWDALMPAAYGPLDPARDCWTGVLHDDDAGEERSFCMRPRHAAPAPGMDGLMLLVAAGHEFGADIARYDCHACAGALGLFVVEWAEGETGGGSGGEAGAGGGAVLRAALPLVRLGAWGETTPARLVVPLRLGAARWGWALGFDHDDRGTLRRQLYLFGATGGEIRPLGLVELSEYWGADAARPQRLAIAADGSDPEVAAYPLVLRAPDRASGPAVLRLEPGGPEDGGAYRVRDR